MRGPFVREDAGWELSGSLTLDASTVTNNFNNAASSGGGIHRMGGSVTLINDASVTGNDPDNCFPRNTIPGCVS